MGRVFVERKSFEFETTHTRKVQCVHSPFHIFLIIFEFILFLVTMFINAAASSPSLKILKQQTGDISNNNPTLITPAGWTFSTWGIIYAWQALWLVYNFINIFRKTEYGYLYNSPPILTPLFHIFYILNLCFNIVWLFLWDEELFGFSFGALAMLTLSLYFSAIVTHKNLIDSQAMLARSNSKDIWLMRFLVNNGVAFYATWVTVATMLNFSISLIYDFKVLDMDKSSLLSICLLACLVLVYFIIDIYLLEEFTRYTLSPYVQLAIAFAGILAKNWNPNSPTAIVTLVLAIVAPGCMFLIKIFMTIYKYVKFDR